MSPPKTLPLLWNGIIPPKTSSLSTLSLSHALPAQKSGYGLPGVTPNPFRFCANYTRGPEDSYSTGFEPSVSKETKSLLIVTTNYIVISCLWSEAAGCMDIGSFCWQFKQTIRKQTETVYFKVIPTISWYDFIYHDDTISQYYPILNKVQYLLFCFIL